MITYTITRPSWLSSTIELRDNDRIIGDVKMLKKWSYALAEATMDGRTVHFGYEGWNARKIFIKDADGNDVATVKSLSSWKYDVAVTIDGKTYTWKQKNWWGTQFGWFDESGHEIMQSHLSGFGFKRTLEAQSPLNKTQTLLALFELYLTKLQEMEMAASGTGALV